MTLLEPDHEAAAVQMRIHGYALVGPFNDEQEGRAFIEDAWTLLPQYDGEYVYHVRARSEFAALPLSQGYLAIGPHTEGIAYESPPRYLALHCLQPAGCGGGHTNLYDGYRVLGELQPAELRYCRSESFQFLVSGQFDRDRPNRASKPIVGLSPAGELRISFSDNFFRWGDLNPTDLATERVPHLDHAGQQVVRKLLSACDRNQIKILIPRNAMLVWDNYRMLHSRDSYTDARRHIVRYWLEHKP